MVSEGETVAAGSLVRMIYWGASRIRDCNGGVGRPSAMTLSPDSDLRKRWTRVLPAVFITYSLAYLDRANYGFGAAAGLAQTLHISGYQSNLLGALFFLGYFLPQIPGVILVQRYSARLLIFLALIAWGAFAALTGVIRSFWLLAADRMLLGVAESFVFPALLIVLTRWFTRTERSRANSDHDPGESHDGAVDVGGDGIFDSRMGVAAGIHFGRSGRCGVGRVLAWPDA